MNTGLITGASKGIGFEVARQLGERGFHVFVTARNREAGQKGAAALHKSGANVSFVELDVTSPKSISNAAESVAEQADHLDVLVNNAAIMDDGDHNILQVDAALAERIFITNTLRPLRVAQA